MPILDVRIAAGSDDASQSGVTVITNGTTSGNNLDAANEYAGMRFVVPDIATGDTVIEAWLRIRVTGSGTDEPLVDIYAQDTDNAATFTTTNNDISGRTATTAVVRWDVADLGSGTNSPFNTPSLVSVVQEIIDRPGWSPGNGMALIIKGEGSDANRDLTFQMFENASGAELAAILHIVYQRPGETTLILEPGAGGDDGYRFLAGSFNNSSNDIDFGKATVTGVARTYRGFCRFPAAAIPAGATIENAKLRFIAAASDSAACVIDYYLNDVDDATAPTTAAQVDALALTTATVQQTMPAWTSDSPYHSDDITAVVQEVIDRGGWASGNDLMALMWGDPSTDNGSGTLFLRRAATFERAVGQPQLIVDYSVAGGASVVPMIAASYRRRRVS